MSLSDLSADRGLLYRQAWPQKSWLGSSFVREDVDFWLEQAARSPELAHVYGAKALKWGASPEAVAQALAAVAS